MLILLYSPGLTATPNVHNISVALFAIAFVRDGTYNDLLTQMVHEGATYYETLMIPFVRIAQSLVRIGDGTIGLNLFTQIGYHESVRYRSLSFLPKRLISSLRLFVFEVMDYFHVR